MAWKHYPTKVCLKYGLNLVGYPHDEICDPSNLTVDELFALRETLQKGTCGFKRLPDSDKDALQLTVDEQERRGENPWGKRKRRSDAGKPKKKRNISEPSVHLEMDSDSDDMSIGQPCSSRMPIPVSASSNAHIAGLAGHPALIAPSTITTTTGAHTQQLHSEWYEGPNLLPKVLPACGSINHDDDSESGEEELEQEPDDDPMPHLARCITSYGGNPEYPAWGA